MTSFSAAACVSSASEAGVRMTSRSLSWTSSSTRLVTVTGNASLPRRPFEPIRRRKRRSACSTGISSAPSSIRYSRSAARSKTAPRSAPTARTRLPDQALVDLRPRFDLLVRVDPHPGRDDALGADQDVVADRNALVDAHVRPDLAPPADDRAFDDGALAEVRRSIDDRAGDARALAEGHARLEHGVRADRSLGRDAAVVADEGRPLDALEVLDVDPLPHPAVPAQPDAGDAQAHALAERVARDDEEGVVQAVAREADGAGSAERRLLNGVLHREPERLAVAEVAADRLRQEGDRDDHLLEAVRADELEDVLHARLADDRDHRLRLVRGQRAEPRSLAAGHHDGLHGVVSLRAVTAYWTKATTASAMPAQKIQSGQSSPLCVTIARARAAKRSRGAPRVAATTYKRDGRPLEKTICFPSGDQLGCRSSARELVRPDEARRPVRADHVDVSMANAAGRREPPRRVQPEQETPRVQMPRARSAERLADADEGEAAAVRRPGEVGDEEVASLVAWSVLAPERQLALGADAAPRPPDALVRVRDRRAVRRPGWREVEDVPVRELLVLAAVSAHAVDPGERRGRRRGARKRDPGAVGRPGGRGVEGPRPGRNTPEARPVAAHAIQREAVAAVPRDVSCEGDPAPVR